MTEYASFDHANTASMSASDSGPYISTCKQDQPDLDQSRLEALQYPPQAQVQDQLQDLQSQAGLGQVDNQFLSLTPNDKSTLGLNNNNKMRLMAQVIWAEKK